MRSAEAEAILNDTDDTLDRHPWTPRTRIPEAFPKGLILQVSTKIFPASAHPLYTLCTRGLSFHILAGQRHRVCTLRAYKNIPP